MRRSLKVLILVTVIGHLLFFVCSTEKDPARMRNDLQVEFSGDRAQIEVGGPYAGIEMHNSAPALNRISFYYPRANSVDVSQDYWKREKYPIMDIGIRFGDQLKRWIGTEPFDFTLTPCTIHLVKKDSAFSMKVVQIIGSTLMGKGRDEISYLVKHHEKETRAYEAYVLDAAYGGHHLETGDDVLDHSVHWSKAILTVNAHVLDGTLVPMPCPAQYNFYFTHDVLLTDLAVIFFDTHRVKRDLEFIIQHADSLNTIPHAYYWRDDRYVTEYALSDNWNHFWFTLVPARYLRHTGDTAFLENLYPYIERSIQLALENLGKDDLMWAYRPDWWDIGSSFGQRSYMTILTMRALEAFNYISTVLGKDAARMSEVYA